MNKDQIKNSRGFGLIEVLLAMAILTIGLLGMAGLQGFSIAEAADVAGIKAGTFKSRLNRALVGLRQSMGDTGRSEDE